MPDRLGLGHSRKIRNIMSICRTDCRHIAGRRCRRRSRSTSADRLLAFPIPCHELQNGVYAPRQHAREAEELQTSPQCMTQFNPLQGRGVNWLYSAIQV